MQRGSIAQMRLASHVQPYKLRDVATCMGPLQHQMHLSNAGALHSSQMPNVETRLHVYLLKTIVASG